MSRSVPYPKVETNDPGRPNPTAPTSLAYLDLAVRLARFCSSLVVGSSKPLEQMMYLNCSAKLAGGTRLAKGVSGSVKVDVWDGLCRREG